MNVFGNVPQVTKNLLIVNLIVFVATLVNEKAIFANFALFYPLSHNFHAWQFVTYMFVHGGLWHLIFNMYALFIFGSVIENVIGSKKFGVFYFVCGIGAAAINVGVQTLTHSYAPVVGASGAIYGILIAYAMLFPTARLTLIFPPISLSAKTWVIIFVCIELLTGLKPGLAPGIAHFAHLGGMLFGFLLMWFWRKTDRLFDRDLWI